MKLIVTIDVEEDAGPGWVSPSIPTFHGVTEGLKNRLYPLFRDLGVMPTLMLSPIVLQDRASVEVLRQFDNIELAAHLHWEQIGPHAERTLRGGTELLKHMQRDHAPDAERAKLEALTELFHQQFDRYPTAFRAGRYGASRVTGAILRKLGYEVDTSATPHIQWRTPANNPVDFTRIPEQPYYISEEGNIFESGTSDFLEVPITILPPHKIPGLTASPWFRPAYATLETLKEMVRIVRERNVAGVEQPLVMMFHNVEVIANASPYTKTEADVGAYLYDMREALDYAIGLGFEPCTLTDYARDYKSRHAPSVMRAQAVRPRLPRVLFCVDMPNWAHDFKATNLIKNLSGTFDCRKCFDGQIAREDVEWADVVIVFFWVQFLCLNKFMDVLKHKIVLTGISCHTDMEGNKRALGMRVHNTFHGVFVNNRILYDEYRDQFSKPFYLNQNGVDTDFYCPTTEPKSPGEPLVVGWAGSLSNHGSEKRGFHDIIIPAVAMTPGVELRVAASEEKWRSPEEMLDFYRGLDVYLVASRVEGTPNPGLESAACGVPSISTRVGNMPELIRDGINGFLVDRTPKAFSDRLAQLRDTPALLQSMRRNIRHDIRAWDWSTMSRKYATMIAESLSRYGWKPSTLEGDR